MTVLLRDYAFVLMGAIFVAAGFFGRKFYYGDLHSAGGAPAPAKFAKPFFMVIGTLFVVMGFGDLFGFISLKTK